MTAVHLSKHSLFRLKITVGCRLCAHPSIHFSRDEDTLKITVGCRLCAYPSIRVCVESECGVCDENVCVGCTFCVLVFWCIVMCVLCVLGCVLGCVCVCAVWCGVCVARLGTRKKTVCRSKTSPCVPAKKENEICNSKSNIPRGIFSITVLFFRKN